MFLMLFFVLFDSLRPSLQPLKCVGTGLTGLNQYYARINVSSLRTLRSDAGEARIRVIFNVYFYHDLLVMTLDSFNAFTVTVTPQSVLWKYNWGKTKIKI